MLHNCKYKDLIKWLDVWWHHKTIYFPPCCTSISCIIISKLGHRGHTPVWCPWRVGSHAEVIIWTWGKGLIVQRVLIHHYRRSSVLRLPGIFFWPPKKKKMCMVLLNWIYLVNIFNWIETIWSFYQFCSRPGLGKMLPWMKFVKIFHHELNLHYFCELAWIMLLAVNEMFEKSPSELTYLLTSLDKYVIRKTCYCVCLKYLCAS